MYYKIVLSGTKQPIHITEEKLEKLSQILSSPNKPKFITIGDEILNTNFIVAVLVDHERNRTEAYHKRIGMGERKRLPSYEKSLTKLKKKMSLSPQERTKAQEEAARKERVSG